MTSDDLKVAYAALAGKQTAYNELWAYYDGHQPLVYSTTKLREIFNDINARFSENWCAVVVDSTADRLNLARFTVADNDAATSLLNDMWTATQMHLDSDDAHLAALVTGEAFVIVWREGDEPVQAYYNDPRLCHVQYDEDNPRVPRFAVKWWKGHGEKLYLTLYYPDRLEYYVSNGKAENVSSAEHFSPAETPMAENPFGMIPVFHLRRERRVVKSELANVIEPQNAVNKLLNDMMIAAEFGAMRQRYIIAAADPGTLKNAPNEIWMIPAGDGAGQQTQVGELSATDLTGYLTAMDNLANKIATITRTPKHYIMSQGGDPSGEALIAMEAPLVKKCERLIERFSVPWRQAAAFMLRLAGQEVAEADIVPEFDPVSTVQPRARAEIRKLSVDAGMPLSTVLRASEGWDEAQLAAMEADEDARGAKATESLAAGMVRAQRDFDRGDVTQTQR